MHLIIPHSISSQIQYNLKKAGRKEIGGILMGEHLGDNVFEVKEITIQLRGGSFARFIRFVSGFLDPLRTFFESTRHDYKRFNYLGEWHSHHSFLLVPSSEDHNTMQSIASDETIGAHFVILLLVKLGTSSPIDCSVTVYRPHISPYSGDVFQRQI